MLGLLLAAAAASTSADFDASAQRQRLSELLAENDFASLQAAIEQPRSEAELSADLDWLQEKFRNGASVYVAFEYAGMLLAVADAAPQDQRDGLRGTALGALLYAATASRLDALQCEDATARDYRANQAVQHIADSGLTSLDKSARNMAAVIALLTEQQTWNRRKAQDDSAFLCSGGMGAMLQGLASGNVREVKPQKGQIGRQFVVGAPGQAPAARRGDADWWPEAEELRGSLPEQLKLLAGLDQLPDVDKAMASTQKAR